MGHTIPPKRNIIYGKLEDMKKFAKAIREPYRSRFLALVASAYQDVSAMVYANSLDDDEMILYAILLERAKTVSIESDEKILRCLAILLEETPH
jgi:hypothetical protein